MGLLAVTKSLALAVVAFLPASALVTGEYELVAHLRQQNLKDFEKLFWEIAKPDSPKYLQHQSLEDVSAFIGASDSQIESARAWLLELGGQPTSVRVSALRDSVTATFAAASSSPATLSLSALSVQKPDGIEFVLRRDPKTSSESSSVDAPARARLEEKQVSSTSGYTVANIKKAYGIPTDLQASSDKTLQMVWGPGSFGYSKIQLGFFKLSQCPLLNMSKVQYDTANHGHMGDNYMEGNLDTTMISTFGLNVETLVSNTNTSASTEEGLGFGQAMLDFVTELSSRKVVPHVLSLSLGSLASASCSKLCSEAVKKGFTMEQCQSYLQSQRQVCMYLSDAQSERISTAFQVLGSRGVTIFGSSGDGGSHFSFQEFSGGDIAKALNEISCEFQMPVFPTTSPYIVSVGGEMWSGDSSKPVTWEQSGSGSGSGFSWEFDMPDHQKTSTAAYLSGTADLPPTESFNAKGRAYPDMSSIAVEGTSQSAPMTAGIWSLIIDQRLSAGLPPLGFLAPRLWKVAEENPGEAFQSITVGNSKTSCDNGFPSGNSWDPNTGWGRPVWAGLVKHFASDSQIGEKELVV